MPIAATWVSVETGCAVSIKAGKYILKDAKGVVKEVAPEDVEELLKNLNQGKREILSSAELMSPEDAERYLKFLEAGSTEGLTKAELEGIKKVDALLALNMVDYQDILDVRNAKNALEGGTSTLSGQWKTVNENMSDFSRAYQKQITGQEGMAWVQNGVKFDGMKDGVLLDAKGKYAQFIDKSTGEFYEWFSGKDSLIAEARRQITASEGAKIQWYFAEEESLNVVQDLFMDKGIMEIELIFESPK